VPRKTAIAPPWCPQVLVALRAHPDGSFDMQPGFSAPGRRYRFEDPHGARGLLSALRLSAAPLQERNHLALLRTLLRATTTKAPGAAGAAPSHHLAKVRALEVSDHS
jgi:hypothetical protein